MMEYYKMFKLRNVRMLVKYKESSETTTFKHANRSHA